MRLLVVLQWKLLCIVGTLFVTCVPHGVLKACKELSREAFLDGVG